MKKIVLGTALVLMLAVTASGYAEVNAGAYSLTPFLGGYTFEGNEDLKRNNLTYGIRAGYSFTRNWGLEAYLHHVPTESRSQAGSPDVDLVGYGVEALYHFMPEGRLVPFLAAGMGGAHYAGSRGVDDRNAFTVDYGAGLKYFLTDNVALRADVRHFLPLNDRYNNLLYTVGLTFAWGGEKKPAMVAAKAAEPAAPVAVVLDSDNDGVPDKADKCPGTPAGVKVDKYGCPIDSDGDGVPDYLDKCPNTPANVTSSEVDKDGCPVDSDKDGVPDYLDKCPGTPADVKVDSDGCPLDSDKDGVFDYLDKCPDTPLGVKVDKDGCPPPVVKTEAPVPPMEKAMFERGRVTLNVEFDFDKSVIKQKYHEEIGNLAAVMKKYPDLHITIEGHTDNVGGAKYNQKLSERRAKAVKKYLVEKFGIEASRLNAVGYGLKMPVASNATTEGREKNRRVEAAAEYMIKK